jgi:menaquinone-dependent protoporphyrinogen oxidase
MRVLIIYASTHGQTEKIARRIADVVQHDGATCDVVSVEDAGVVSLSAHDVVILAGSVHFGRHQRKLEALIERKLAALTSTKCALVSVSGAAATADGRDQAEAYVRELSRRTGWVPEVFVTIGGGEPYTRYGFFTRILMRSIARRHGRQVDVHTDYEFTDWDAVDRFARDFIRYASAKRTA